MSAVIADWTRRNASRADVVAEALSWVGTPFHHCADVKGAGVDCAMILVRIFIDLGLVPPFDPRPYKPQWYQHSSEMKYLGGLERYSKQVERAEPGDIELFNFGKHAAHGAIVIDERSMVHAYLPAKAVILDERRTYAGKYHSAWSVFA